MTVPRRANNVYQERVVVDFDHGALTAGVASSFLTPTRKLRVDGIKYINPTGLVAHADNWFTVDVRRSGSSDTDLPASQTFTAEADDETATKVAHGLSTGDGPFTLTNAGGALPSGLATVTNYWIIRVTADTFRFAATRALAFVGTAIALADDGTGTHTLVTSAASRHPVTIATGIDTDADTGASLAADSWITLTTADDETMILESGDELLFVAVEGGNATLPAGRLVVEGRYL